MEGKEVRLGPVASATWAAMTTATSNGSVNSMHDSFQPLGGLVPMSLMMLNVDLQRHRRRLPEHADVHHRRRVPRRADGGANARIPGQEDRGQGGEAGDDRRPDPPALDLPAARPCSRRPTGAARRSANPGPHGFSEVLYEFTLGRGQQRLGFRGLGRQQPARGTSPRASSCCWAGSRRWCCPLAIAGFLAEKKRVPQTSGTLLTNDLTFAGDAAGDGASGRCAVVHAGRGPGPDRRPSSTSKPCPRPRVQAHSAVVSLPNNVPSSITTCMPYHQEANSR